MLLGNILLPRYQEELLNTNYDKLQFEHISHQRVWYVLRLTLCLYSPAKLW
jgi:hypothetical protein